MEPDGKGSDPGKPSIGSIASSVVTAGLPDDVPGDYMQRLREDHLRVRLRSGFTNRCTLHTRYGKV
jgi:hypothetical protein